jgi:hypothetical protein
MVREERSQESIDSDIERLIKEHFALGYSVKNKYKGHAQSSVNYGIRDFCSLTGLLRIVWNDFKYDVDISWLIGSATDREYPKITVCVNKETCAIKAREFSRDYESRHKKEVTIIQKY